MASIRRRVSIRKTVSWQVRWYAANGQLRSRTFSTQREAKAYRVKVETYGAMSRPRGAGERQTLGEALEYWLAANDDRWRSKTKIVNHAAAGHLEPLSGVRIDRLTPELVKEVSDRISPYTGRQVVNAVKGALRLAQQAGHEVIAATMRLSPPRTPEGQQRALSADQVEKLANRIGSPHGDLVQLLAYTGLRVGEMAGLEIRDFDSVRNRISVRRGISWVSGGAVVSEVKTINGKRSIPLTETGRYIIERRISDRPEEHRHPYAPIVLGPRGGARWNPQNWRRDAGWKAALQDLGLGRVRLHDLRHTYASLVRRSGADIYVLQKVLGHQAIATTIDLYGHLYDDEIDELGAALNRAISNQHGQNMA